MKKTTQIVILATLLLGMLACKKDDISGPVSGNVEITVELNDQLISNSSAQPSAIVTIEDYEGNTVFNNATLPLNITEGKYSARITNLEPGSYNLTKFMVVTEGLVLHAVPMGYSPKSNLSDNPLPVKFFVQAGVVTELAPAVVKTQGYVAQDFGYKSFNLNEKATFSFKISAYILNSQTKQLELTSASLSLVSTQNTITSAIGDNKSIQLTEGSSSYVLTVAKDGFQTWSETLSEDALLRYYYSPLKVYLERENVNTISFITGQDSLSRVNVYLNNSDNNPLVISWGDGKIELAGINTKTSHDYSYPGKYTVKIYGKVENITKLGLTQCNIVSVDLSKAAGLSSLEISRNSNLQMLNISSLPGLKEVVCVEGGIESINFAGSDSIEVLHCSVNKLKSLDLTLLPNLKVLFCDRNQIENIDITKNLNLTSIYLSNNAINNVNANQILVALLENVKTNNRTGQINLSVKPTGEGKDAMDALVNTYLWNISF